MIAVLLILLIGLFLAHSQVCQIDAPIGIWLKNQTNMSCDIVNGHFILDSSANSLAERVFKTFKGLKRIDGCIHVKNYKGSRNLSFFSQLEDVICDKKEAKGAKLKNVIYIKNPYLYTMGFNSLRNVSGPGEIFLSFEEFQETYGSLYYQESYKIEGRSCFNKKELIFLARHPQYKGKMYRPCESKDPCLRPELFKEFYTFQDIPDYCTIFAGFICLAGPYSDDLPAFRKFENLTILIGKLQVGPNLFTSVDMFKNLEVVYPYQNGNPAQGCYGDSFDLESTCDLQVIHIGLNRFMKNISLPSLLPIRPLEINEPFIRRPITALEFIPELYFPENFEDPCAEFPQFKKKCRLGYQSSEGITPAPVDPWVNEAWLVGAIFVAIGLLFGKRCLAMMLTGQLNNCLPKSQYLIATVILIMMLSAIEGVIINQRSYDTWFFPFCNIHTLSIFSNPGFLHPSGQLIIKLLAISRQTSLIILIFCYPDVILSYCWKPWNPHYSRFYVLFSSIFTIIAFLYFNSKLALETRTLRPHYKHSEVTFMAFVLNIDRQEIFNTWLPPRVPLSDMKFDTQAEFPNMTVVDPLLKDMQLENAGAVFPEISFYCDVIFVSLVIIFLILRISRSIESRDNCNLLIILYLQMSMNRIRSFIHLDILSEEMQIGDMYNFSFGRFLVGSWTVTEFMEDNYWTTDEDQLWIIIRIVEKLPYFTFMAASLLCWKYLLYYRYLGMALIYRETKKKEESKRSIKDAVSDITVIKK